MKTVFSFGSGRADGGAHMADILGGKGANLAEMSNLGIPVPPGFTIAATLCNDYLREKRLPTGLDIDVLAAMRQLEKDADRRFGDESDPLLVSVRSGARVSMPGMMDTILNLGLNDRTVIGLATRSDNARFAFDSYRRFVQMYGEVVFGLKGDHQNPDPLEHALSLAKERSGAARDIDLEASELKNLVVKFKEIIKAESGADFPEDPWEQLWGAVEAVFESWQTKRAADYRKVHGIPDDVGTAVNIVAMVYGNMGEDCGTGVAFTRDPSTGEARLFGEFLTNAQGEDVVAGRRDPEPIASMADKHPLAFQALLETCAKLEAHFRDAQDIEFTIQSGQLYMLQTRRAKRTARAAVRIAVEMVTESRIDHLEALRRVQPEQLDQLLHPTVDPSAQLDVLATGLPASPGAAVGMVVFDADTAQSRAESGDTVILVRRETSPDDFHGMVAAEAILTQRGGMTSHAAVVARGMGKSCVAGCKELDVRESEKRFLVGDQEFHEGDWITLDGSTGRVMRGRVSLVEPRLDEYFDQIMHWSDQVRMLRIRANADNAADAKRARKFGAEGIGLCRTEHMFFEGDRITAMREMILAADVEGRREALAKLLPMQRGDFREMFEVMDGLPVTIRLLDPPLHEFLPHEDDELEPLAKSLRVPVDRLRHTVSVLTEANPMLGHRGCRLGITYPEITEMQARAIIEAACEADVAGISVLPEIMIPLIATAEELRRQTHVVREVAERVFTERNHRVDYLVGTMIELPRAALTADEIADVAEFFSFGTNDLTQTTFGLSRDDAGRFLPAYVESGILPADPFQTIDRGGVGRLVGVGVGLGRERNPKLKIGICGEHGGDPASVIFCHQIGLNYVSCSPFRIPIARLAAAHAALVESDNGCNLPERSDAKLRKSVASIQQSAIAGA